MTEGPINANDIGIYVSGVLVACLDSATFTSEKTQIDVICKDYRGTLNGSLKWGLSGSGKIRWDATYGAKELLEAHLNDDVISVKFGTAETGDTVITGNVIVSKMELASGVDEAGTYNFDLPGQGDYTVGTNP